MLLTHFWEDAHPDHIAASALVDAARFWAKLSKTDMPGAPWFPEKIVYFFTALSGGLFVISILLRRRFGA